MKPDFKFLFRRRKKLTSLLGLALDGSRLDGVVLKRANGALQPLQTFSIPLTLDPLTAAPELVGREIRNGLDAAGVHERHCVLGLPLKWVLTAQTELPPLPEADAASLLQLEAERGFPADVATLQIANSRVPLAGDKKQVLLVAIPQPHLLALEKVLVAAKLKPVSFTLGISALQYPGAEKSGGVLALVIGAEGVGLQITAGGGLAALRALEGAVENETGRPVLHAEMVARETRITLGQLPAEVGAAVKRIRVFGPRELAQPLVDELELKFGPVGLTVERVTACAPDEFGLTLPVGAPVSAAFCLAARRLAEQPPVFEFQPPHPGLVEQFVTKYSSGRWRTAGLAGLAAGVLFAGVFGWQQIRLLSLRSQWTKISARVAQLETIQDEIRQYRPWYDGSFKHLAILRQLSLVFPEDGTVTAKTIQVRDGNTVTCSGAAQDNAGLLAVQARLGAVPGVTEVHWEQSRGNKPPIQFVFSFKFNNGGSHEN
jgi:hypothetical protein